MYFFTLWSLYQSYHVITKFFAIITQISNHHKSSGTNSSIRDLSDDWMKKISFGSVCLSSSPTFLHLNQREKGQKK